LVLGGQLECSWAVVGHTEHGEVVLGVQEDGEPFGQQLLGVGDHQADDRSHAVDAPGAVR
jgi:hypothetical protein